jgi:hypothetical protein
MYPERKKTNPSPSTLWRRLQILENLENLTIETNSRFSLITVCEYDTYNPRPAPDEQPDEQPVNSRCTAGEQPVNTENNKKNVKNEKNARKKRTSKKLCFSDSDIETARWMFELNKILLGDAAPPSFDRWANEIRLLRERDQRTDAEIRELYQWAHDDDFWHQNILCPAKLREKWDRLQIQRKKSHGRSTKSSGAYDKSHTARGTHF